MLKSDVAYQTIHKKARLVIAWRVPALMDAHMHVS